VRKGREGEEKGKGNGDIGVGVQTTLGARYFALPPQKNGKIFFGQICKYYVNFGRL